MFGDGIRDIVQRSVVGHSFMTANLKKMDNKEMLNCSHHNVT